MPIFDEIKRLLSRKSEGAPEVPTHAVRIYAIPHFRAQYHPLFLNPHDMPDHDGPRQYMGMDYRCIQCKNIQPAGPPGRDNQCEKCKMFYKYTALKNQCWLYVWRDKVARIDLDLDEIVRRSEGNGEL